MVKNMLGLHSSVTVFTVILNLCNNVICVKVGVFYEALCYDSIKFIGQQLAPHWSEISPFVDLELVPYGKALHNIKNNEYEFFCQHGATECAGNKYQSCLLAQHLGKDKEVPLVRCIMSSSNPASLILVKECSRKFGFDVDYLRECIESKKADQLLAINGEKTWTQIPNLSFVPTVVFDGHFNQKETDQALIDFVAVVCSKLVNLPENTKKPQICDGKQVPKIEVWDEIKNVEEKIDYKI